MTQDSYKEIHQKRKRTMGVNMVTNGAMPTCIGEHQLSRPLPEYKLIRMKSRNRRKLRHESTGYKRNTNFPITEQKETSLKNGKSVAAPCWPS